MKVTLDAGHGGKDPGAIGQGLQEKDIALSTTLKVGNILNKHGIKVHYTRETDIYVGLQERAKRANNNGSSIFVSIHVNSVVNHNAHGMETLFYPTSVEGKKLAQSIQSKLKKIATADRGIKPRSDLTVLSKTNMPAVIVEMGFIRNKKDIEILTKRQDEVVELIGQGILEYLGIKYVVEKNIDNEPSSWAKEDWNWAIVNNITDGSNPKGSATREQVVTMIRRAMGVK